MGVFVATINFKPVTYAITKETYWVYVLNAILVFTQKPVWGLLQNVTIDPT